MLLHPPTLFFVIVVISGGLAVFSAVLAHRRYADITLWSGAMALHGAAYTLFSLRGQIPDLLSIVVANSLLALMFAMFALGIYRFQNKPAPHALIWPAVAVTAVGFLWLLDNPRGRYLLGGVVFGYQCILLLLVLGRQRQAYPGRGQLLLMLGLLVILSMLFIRSVGALQGDVPGPNLTDTNTLLNVSLLLVVVSLLCFSMGFMAMHQERADHVSRQAVAELKVSESRYRRFIETANEGICVIDGDGSIRFVNPKLAELLGTTQASMLARSFLEFVHPDDRAQGLKIHQDHLAGTTEVFRFSLRLRTLHQDVRWFEVGGTVFEWEGQPATLNFLTDITERKQLEAKVHSLAYQDALTAVANRRQLMDQLQLVLAHNKRSGKHGAVLFMDMDNFKPLNDTHGHGAGDMLLVEAALRLKAVVRETDTVARFGGDEFVLLLSNLDAQREQARTQALEVAHKVLHTLSIPYHITVQQHGAPAQRVEHQCGASIGVALFFNEADSAEKLLQQADAAMYQSKQAGKNRVSFFEG